MTRIDRPALRVSSHQRRSAALAQFVRRHADGYRPGTAPDDCPLDSAGLARLLREDGEQD